MIFNAELQMTPLAIKEMVRQYHNASHTTLSKYIGFNLWRAVCLVMTGTGHEERMTKTRHYISTRASLGEAI